MLTKGWLIGKKFEKKLKVVTAALYGATVPRQQPVNNSMSTITWAISSQWPVSKNYIVVFSMGSVPRLYNYDFDMRRKRNLHCSQQLPNN
jgi:hypothetical protein